MAIIFSFIGIYLMPILCVALIFCSVELAIKIKKGVEDTLNLTIVVAVLFTLIVYTPIYLFIITNL
ncbi:hypothetical protein [Bacillus sp. EAC]|uniref:hypothetical protein n=1 Tax=Bacillus sp. EAC TaxID=1978338 RepID=UPI000B436538|nr:hypothetical protein [Bacillus sp. EAC]